MKPALQSPFRCPDPRAQEKPVSRWLLRVYGALRRGFLTWLYRRRINRTMDSFFRVAEALKLDPMKNPQPKAQAAKLQAVHGMMDTLRNLNYSHLTNRPQQP